MEGKSADFMGALRDLLTGLKGVHRVLGKGWAASPSSKVILLEQLLPSQQCFLVPQRLLLHPNCSQILPSPVHSLKPWGEYLIG